MEKKIMSVDGKFMEIIGSICIPDDEADRGWMTGSWFYRSIRRVPDGEIVAAWDEIEDGEAALDEYFLVRDQYDWTPEKEEPKLSPVLGDAPRIAEEDIPF